MKILTIICFLSLILSGCREPFEIDSISFEQILVVEGQLTNETKNHKVTLSFTYPIDSVTLIPESGAQISILDGSGQEFTFTETSIPGTYESIPFAGVTGQSYTLYILTRDGEQFQSGTVIQKPVAPIDTMIARFIRNDQDFDGVQVYVSSYTNDKQISKYYRWEWVETYEIRAQWPSQYIWVGGNDAELRTESVGNCYATSRSNNINVRSTDGLSENRIDLFPLSFVPNGSTKLRSKYSLEARQYSLDNASFTYWKTLRDVLSKQGSLADVQPGNLSGNIFNENGARVLGYFDASDVARYRIFIEPSQFRDDGFVVNSQLFACSEIRVTLDGLGSYMSQYNGTHVIYIDADPVAPDPNGEGGLPAGWLIVPKNCGDCTASGTNVRPSFWE
ncbi:MAG: DUF4249 domain-containing protein [Cyclobacteriaceae bacterium]